MATLRVHVTRHYLNQFDWVLVGPSHELAAWVVSLCCSAFQSHIKRYIARDGGFSQTARRLASCQWEGSIFARCYLAVLKSGETQPGTLFRDPNIFCISFQFLSVLLQMVIVYFWVMSKSKSRTNSNAHGTHNPLLWLFKSLVIFIIGHQPM